MIMGKICDRKNGLVYEDVQYGKKYLNFLYNNIFGRIILKIVILPFFSKMIGKYYDSKASVKKIDKFVKTNGIDMSSYENRKYSSFNDFFTRKKKNVEITNKNMLISPADSKLLVYDIDEKLKINIKDSDYDLYELVNKDVTDLSMFENGKILVFRLSVDDYHRYCFPADGELIDSYEIPGKLHTVSSISRRYKIYKENHRIVNLLDTVKFGNMYFIEVGALLVGKIVNNNLVSFKTGDEKGYFKYGGSTIVMIVSDRVIIDDDIIKNSNNGLETKVNYGEPIGKENA